MLTPNLVCNKNSPTSLQLLLHIYNDTLFGLQHKEKNNTYKKHSVTRLLFRLHQCIDNNTLPCLQLIKNRRDTVYPSK